MLYTLALIASTCAKDVRALRRYNLVGGGGGGGNSHIKKDGDACQKFKK